jgi:hypothetical protein
MGRYEPLSEFLRKHEAQGSVEMTFAQIESVIRAPLPRSARIHRAWWSNNEQNSAMTRAWREAGFLSTRVDMKAEKLTFRHRRALDNSDKDVAEGHHGLSQRHPLIGWLKGTFTVAPGVDLTKPAMPEWGEVAYGDKTWDDVK